MRRIVAGPALAAILLVGGAGPASAYHERDRCHYEDCDDGWGDGNGNSGGDYGHGRNGDQDGRGNCHSFCNITVPTPPLPGGGGGHERAGFIPPNPSKIPQQIADFVKIVSEFVQAVLKFAV